MYHKTALWGLSAIAKDLLKIGFEEDGIPWDWTALGAAHGNNSTLTHPRSVTAKLVAKGDGVWSGDPVVEAASLIAHDFQMELEIKREIADGKSFKNGQTLLILQGDAHFLLALERPLINLAAFLSGISSRTALINQAIQSGWKKLNTDAKVPRLTLTRKTLPGYRDLSVHAVVQGGGYPHRVSLAGGVLIKENHIEAAGGIKEAIHGAREVSPHGLKIEIEVKNLKELETAITEQADGVLLDNFSESDLKSGLALIESKSPSLLVEVSGGIREENLSSVLHPGIHIISSGALTHSVTSSDFSLLFDAD